MEERKTDRQRDCVCVMGKNIQFLPKQASIDICLCHGFFLKLDTSSQLITLKDAVKIEMRDLKNLFIRQPPGWRLVPAHDISPALLDGCRFHGLQNISGQTVSALPSHAAGTMLSVGFVFN